MQLSLYLSIHLSVHVMYPSILPSTYSSICPFILLSVSLPVCQSVSLSICQAVRLSVCQLLANRLGAETSRPEGLSGSTPRFASLQSRPIEVVRELPMPHTGQASLAVTHTNTSESIRSYMSYCTAKRQGHAGFTCFASSQRLWCSGLPGRQHFEPPTEQRDFAGWERWVPF